MPGFNPGIHVFLADLEGSKTWMAGINPAMTECVAALRRAHCLQEFRDLGLQAPALDRKRLRGTEHLRRSRAGLLRAGADIADIARDLGCGLGGVLRVAGDL